MQLPGEERRPMALEEVMGFLCFGLFLNRKRTKIVSAKKVVSFTFP